MAEFDLPGVQAQGRIVQFQGLRVPHGFAKQLHGVAADRNAEVPEVDADLVGAARQGPRF